MAYFHLANGVRVERLNLLADPSSNEMRRSLGMMVNYRYRLREIENNRERHKADDVINASSVVRGLAQKRG